MAQKWVRCSYCFFLIIKVDQDYLSTKAFEISFLLFEYRKKSITRNPMTLNFDTEVEDYESISVYYTKLGL